MGNDCSGVLGKHEIPSYAEGPIKPWLKVVAFAIGLAAALGAYRFVGPRFPAWRSWTMTRLTRGASTDADGERPRSPSVRGPSPPNEIQSASPIVAGSSAG